MEQANDLKDRWMHPREAAAHLGINLRTLNEWRRLRDLPAHRIGHRTIVYRREDLDAWVREHDSLMKRKRGWKKNGPAKADPSNEVLAATKETRREQRTAQP